MNDLCVDIGYGSINKFGEQICGDHVDVSADDENNTVAVLADGLGSGVKAGILSTLTSKILSIMLTSQMTIDDCVNTVVSTLPVCSVRQIAYSTFTVFRIKNNDEAEIIQYDNPYAILLRNGKNVEYDMSLREIEGKKVYTSKVKIEQDDLFISMSDGAVHAGVGRAFNFGWQREDIIKFMEDIYDPGFTAKTLTTMLLDECNKLYGYEPGDDTTVCVAKIRKREPVHLMIGPPENRDDVRKMMTLFFSKPGKHIVCGGTTSKLAAGHLGRQLVPTLDFFDPDIPPIAKIEGVDLVTEGVLTINRVLEYANNYHEDNSKYSIWGYKKDGASQIARILFETATDINFYVGKAVNPAHQNLSLPINFNIKMRLVEELAESLKKMGKRIKISYF